MIKGTEVRIGNLVHTETGVVQTIEFIDRDDKDGYFPIPLTEEWLLKFGFKKDTEGYTLGRFEIYHFHQKPESDFITAWGYSLSTNEMSIKYVHQLQNLYFALTGTELTYIP